VDIFHFDVSPFLNKGLARPESPLNRTIERSDGVKSNRMTHFFPFLQASFLGDKSHIDDAPSEEKLWRARVLGP
jgi:hypothetical protein